MFVVLVSRCYRHFIDKKTEVRCGVRLAQACMLVNDRERELGTLDMSTFPQSYCCGTYNQNRKSRSCDEGKSLVSAGIVRAVFTEGEGDMTRILRKPINSEIPRYWEAAPSFPHEVKLISVL